MMGFVAFISLLSTSLMIVGAIWLNSAYYRTELSQRLELAGELVVTNMIRLIEGMETDLSALASDKEQTRLALVGLAATNPKRSSFFKYFFSFVGLAHKQNIEQMSLFFTSAGAKEPRIYCVIRNGRVFSYSTNEGRAGLDIMELAIDNFGFVSPTGLFEKAKRFPLPVSLEHFDQASAHLLAQNGQLYLDSHFPLVNRTMGMEKSETTGFAYLGLQYGMVRSFKLIPASWLQMLEDQTGIKLDIYLPGGAHGLGDLAQDVDVKTRSGDGIFEHEKDRETLLTVVNPLIVHNQHIGYLAASIPRSTLSRQKSNTAFILLGIGGLTMILALVFGFLLAILFTRPILNLEQSAIRISKGDLMHPIEIKGNDELTSLARSFIDMRDAIGDKIEELNTEIKGRIEAEEEVRQAEEKYRRMFENASMGIFQTNPEGRVITANPAAAHLLGYENADELLVRADGNFFRQLMPDGNLEVFNALMKGDEDVRGVETRLQTSGGIWVTVSINARLVLDENGDVVMFEGTLLDVSAQKAKEKAESERSVAEAATKAKSEFLAHMSHEIRTPMNAIVGLTGLALKTRLTDKQKDYLTKVEGAAQSLLGIINDILDFSKIEAGRMELEKAEFELDRVLDAISSMISLKAEEKGIELLFSVSSDVPNFLVGDSLRLGQILINLSTNAVKFTDKGQIHLRVETGEQDGLAPDNTVRLFFSVTDTGIGLSDEQQRTLFMSFTQADASTTRKYGGTGLGLTISRYLIQMMEGDICVESEFGRGAKFSFTAVFGRALNKRRKQYAVPESLKNKRALVVDDNPESRMILREALTSFSFDVGEAGSGQEALSELALAAKTKPYDLILLDWKMPQMDGIATARAIGESQGWSDIPPILMVSAYGRGEIMKAAREIGIRDFLVKPVSRSLLFDSILEAFGQVELTYSHTDTEGLEETEGLARIRGARILLVEDNLLNQQVAEELLKLAGLSVTVAGNGLEALGILAHNNEPFDAVLMDLQMPVMDGYEAIRRIRADKELKDIPIIAQTAHALSSEKETCLNLGVNDYVTKPIEPRRLFAALIDWIEPREGRIEEPISFQPVDEEDNIDLPSELDGLNVEDALGRLGGNRGMYLRLLEQFLRMAGKDHLLIREAFEDGELRLGSQSRP